MILVHAQLVVPTAFLDDFVTFMDGYCRQTLGEPGCCAFELTVSPWEATRFTMVESWLDAEAVRHHFRQPWVEAFRERRSAYPIEVSGTAYFAERSESLLDALHAILR